MHCHNVNLHRHTGVCIVTNIANDDEIRSPKQHPDSSTKVNVTFQLSPAGTEI